LNKYLLLSLFLLVQLSLATNINTCTTISSSGVYNLTTDITNYNSGSVCMNISADDVILDCGGHTIDGDGNPNREYGVLVDRDSDTNTNVTIRNCTITDWYYGIRLTHANNNTVEYVTSSSNYEGIRFYNSNSNVITNLTANDNTDYGVNLYVAPSGNNNFTNLTANNNEYGVYIQWSSGNKFVNSVVKDNTKYDLYILVSSYCNNNFTNVTGSGDLPIMLVTSSDEISSTSLSELWICPNADNTNITDVSILPNNNNGLIVQGADNVRISGVTLYNSHYGIQLLSSVGATIYDSNLTNNGYGIYLYNSDNVTAHRVSIINASSYGIYLDGNSGQDGANLFYNIFFNNTNNYYIDDDTITNYWNTTETVEDRALFSYGNIVAGNYWGCPNASCFSDTCSDTDKDGFCDSSYTLASNNIDYKPLSNVSVIGDCYTIPSSASGKTFYLTQNITDSSDSTCIDIQADDVILDCQEHTIDGDDVADYGIRVYRDTEQTTNVTIQNCTVTDWDSANIELYKANGNSIINTTSSSSPDDGIYLYYSSDNQITNVTANNNYDTGITIGYSSNNQLTNILANENDVSIWLVHSSNNQLTNVTANNNYYAIHISYSSNNQLTNVTANNNNDDGSYSIYFSYSSDNQITNSTFNNNYRGIYLLSSSNNTIKSSRIESNTYYGIRLRTAGSTPNKIYNNLLNNTNNIYFDGTIYENYWNTTKTSGTNIIGKNYIGGNFWTNPSGTGYSDTCPDSEPDGLCDKPYDVYNDTWCEPGVNCSDNVDYLPLSYYKYYKNPSLSSTIQPVISTEFSFIRSFNLVNSISLYKTKSLDLLRDRTVQVNAQPLVLSSISAIRSSSVSFGLSSSLYYFYGKLEIILQQIPISLSKSLSFVLNRFLYSTITPSPSPSKTVSIYKSLSLSSVISPSPSSIASKFRSLSLALSFVDEVIATHFNYTEERVSNVSEGTPVLFRVYGNWTSINGNSSYPSDIYQISPSYLSLTNVSLNNTLYYNSTYNNTFVHLYLNNVTMQFNGTINEGDSIPVEIYYTDKTVSITESSPSQGTAYYDEPVRFSKSVSITNPSENDYYNVNADLSIPTDTMNTSVELYDEHNNLVPIEINVSAGLVYFNISSISSGTTKYWTLYYNVSLDYNYSSFEAVDSSTGRNMRHWQVNVTSNVTSIDDVNYIIDLGNTSGITSFNLYYNGTDVTLDPDYSFQISDTDGDGYYDRASWSYDIGINQRQEWDLRGDLGYPINVTSVKIITNEPVIENKLVAWRWGLKFYNNNSFSVDYLYKARVPLSSTEIIVDGVPTDLLFDSYGAYVPVDVHLEPLGSEVVYITYKTPAVSIFTKMIYPNSFWSDKTNEIRIDVTLINNVPDEITDIHKTIPIEHADNLGVYYENGTLLDSEEVVEGEYELVYPSLDGNSEATVSIIYETDVATSELLNNATDNFGNILRLYKLTSVAGWKIDKVRMNIPDIRCTYVVNVTDYESGELFDYECGDNETRGDKSLTVVIEDLDVNEERQILVRYRPFDVITIVEPDTVKETLIVWLVRGTLPIFLISTLYIIYDYGKSRKEDDISRSE